MRVKKRHPWLKLILILLLLGLLSFAVLEGIVLAGAKTEIVDEPEVMLVLGAQVKPWGPSVLLEDRLKTALDYLKEYPDLPVIVSGGQGKDEPTTEAQCMYDYLVAGGIDAQRIHQEDRSHSTSQNFSYSKALLEQLGVDPGAHHVLVVSNDFHLARARMLAKRQGYGQISTLAAPSSHMPSRVHSYLREAPALVKSFLLDR